MININGNIRKTCGLRKMTIDYITTSKKGAEYNTKEDLFRYHTFDSDRGGREDIMRRINAMMGNISSRGRYTPDDVFLALVDKARDSSSDYDSGKAKMDFYCSKLLKFVFDDISKEIDTGKSHTVHETFTTEEDKKGDEKIKVSSEKALIEGSVHSQNDEVIDKIDFNSEKARRRLVECLYEIKTVEDSLFRTKKNYLNIIKFLKGNFAHQHYVALEEGTDLNYASKRKDVFGTFQMYGINLKQTLRERLASDYGGSKTIYKIMKDFMDVCKILDIPIMHIDEDVVMNKEYIDRLYMLINNKNLVCVSEYDLPLFSENDTIKSILTEVVKGESIARNITETKVANYLMRDDISKKIFELKASDYREIGNIVSKIETLHVNNKIERSLTADSKNITNGDRIKNSLSNTAEQRSRENTLYKTIPFYYSVEDNNGGINNIPGPLSDESLAIFREVISRYQLRLLSNFGNQTKVGKIKNVPTNIPYNEEWLKYLSDLVNDMYFMRNDLGLVVDGNGFLKYAKTGHYFEIDAKKENAFKTVGDKDNIFHFSKYLVHSSGFLISKFIDGRINETKRDLDIFVANSKGNFEYLIIMTIALEVLYDGRKGK